MSKIRNFLCAGALALAASPAAAVVLDFDNVPSGSTQNNFGEMPTTNGESDYQGFVFTSNLDWIDTVGSVWNYGAKSGDFTLLNNDFNAGSVSAADGSDFTFDGLWAKRWNTSIESGGPNSLFGTIKGFNDGVEVWSVDTGLNGSFQFFAGQAGAIDRLELGFGNNFLVDDLALNEMTPVPVPAGMVLLASGIFVLRGMRRRSAA